jgi:hypothetical protein
MIIDADGEPQSLPANVETLLRGEVGWFGLEGAPLHLLHNLGLRNRSNAG